MPLRPLTDRSVDRLSDRALHRQLADLLRAAIGAGELEPDERLPSEGELGRMTGLSKTTVRGALDLLDDEGLIVRRAGQAARVARPPRVAHMATERYQRQLDLQRALAPGQGHPLISAFTEDHGVAWSEHAVLGDYTTDVATAAEAALLQIDDGTPVLHRHLIKTVHGVPEQLQHSVIPLDLVRGTPVLDSAHQPWPGGTMRELWEAGWEVALVSEEATARMPDERERRLLELPGGPVLDVTRVFAGFPRVRGDDAEPDDERPVEVSFVVVPAATVRLRWETRLH